MVEKKKEVVHIKPATSERPGFDNFEKTISDTLIVTNPNKRCMYCKGREVLTIDLLKEEVIDSSLIGTPSMIVCKDKQQCSKNIMADKTDVSFVVDPKKGKITDVEITRGKDTVYKVHRGEEEVEEFGK